MSILSQFVTSPPSPEHVFQSTDSRDSPLPSPFIHSRVQLVAIMENQEFSDFHDSIDLSMLSQSRSPTVHDFSQCLTMLMDNKRPAPMRTVEESTAGIQSTKSNYTMDEAVNDRPTKMNASKLMMVPLTPTKKAKRTKHRRSNCVFI